MRKGLVVTLGVVALLLAVSPGFALAPVISAIPDIIISDAEQNTATQDRNFFVFSNALDLDEYVRDDDTPTSTLAWCFIQTAGPAIRINGIARNTSGNVIDPGAFNIRTRTNWASFRNNLWSPTTGTVPYSDPGVTSASCIIQMVVSDGVKTDSQPVVVTTVNRPDDTGQGDALIPHPLKTYPFDSNAGSYAWIWFGPTGATNPPQHDSPAGALTMTKTALMSPIVYGGWGTPNNPTLAGAAKARWGAIMRARFTLTSTSSTPQLCPGFRFRAYWSQVKLFGADWQPDLFSQDFADNMWYQILTVDMAGFFVNRVPGATGKTYTMLYYPQQIDTLMSTQSLVCFSCDMVDDQPGSTDAGTISIDQVDIDQLDRPNVGAPNSRPEPSFTLTDFTGWTAVVGTIVGGTHNEAGLIHSETASGISVTVQTVNTMLELSIAQPTATPLDPGRLYRNLWTAFCNNPAGGNLSPTMRFGMNSSRFVFTVDKELRGGGLFSTPKSTGTPAEVWFVAPPIGAPLTTQTEPMRLRFEVIVESNPDPNILPGNKYHAGTVGVRGVVSESFPATYPNP
jgi:hypothetical protein